MSSTLRMLMGLAAALIGATSPAAADGREEAAIAGICDMIEASAVVHGLPPAFLARVVWRENGFDPDAVRKAGDSAITVPAQEIAGHIARFGNLGLGAAAWFAGEERVLRWLHFGGYLPIETEAFVLDVLGRPVDDFANEDPPTGSPPLVDEQEFHRACRRLSEAPMETVAMSRKILRPWGVQLAGHFQREAAIRQYERIRQRHAALLSDRDPVVSRVRTPRGQRGLYVVRIGVDDRANAEIICQQIRGDGGSCVVARNW